MPSTPVTVSRDVLAFVQYGRVSSHDLLQAILNDPQFMWLRPVSELIVRIDEILEHDEELLPEGASQREDGFTVHPSLDVFRDVVKAGLRTLDRQKREVR